AIDVNNVRYVGNKSSGQREDTIVKTNLEAVKEIVRQIRQRDLGGIIVLDFIDMEEKKNRQKIMQAVEQELKKDRSPSKALAVADFGLVIVTRKRVKQSLERVLTEPCPYCSGTGVIKSSSTICYEILSEVKKVSPELNGHRLLLRVNPDIARALKEEESAVLKDLRQSIGKDVTVKADTQLHHEHADAGIRDCDQALASRLRRPHANSAALRGELDRVLQHVRDDLQHAIGIEEAVDRRRRQRHFEFQGLCVGQRPEQVDGS